MSEEQKKISGKYYKLTLMQKGTIFLPEKELNSWENETLEDMMKLIHFLINNPKYINITSFKEPNK